jgi:hypothetical protein
VALSLDPKQTPIVVRLAATSLEDVGNDELLNKMEQMLANFEAQRINKDYRNAVTANTDRLRGTVSKAIEDETRRLMDNPQYGLRYARAFLERLSDRLIGLRNAFTAEQTQIKERQLRAASEQAALKKALQDAIDSFFVGKGKRVATARDAYIRSKEAEFASEFEVQKLTAAMRLVTDLKAVIDQQIRNVSGLIDKLEQVRDRFETSAEAQLRDRRLPFLSSDITTAEDITRYYQQYKREVDQELVRFAEMVHSKEKGAQSLYDWSGRKVGDIAADIFNFVRQPFEPITQEKIERIIDRRGKGGQVPAGPARRFGALLELHVSPPGIGQRPGVDLGDRRREHEQHDLLRAGAARGDAHDDA